MGCAASTDHVGCGSSSLGNKIVAFDDTQEARAAVERLERSRNVPRLVAIKPAPPARPAAQSAFEELELVDSDEFEAISLAEPTVSSSSITSSSSNSITSSTAAHE
jgi:hypothetical protein